ncbi:MAG TPA: hypothetical protein VHU81_16145 [Thermoanaerobaculia bacterium]|jgi:hypothetical protein|nr:hypothetical protein [Thermoanaerobaculia bacterium]
MELSLTELAERERALTARLGPLRQICRSLAFSVLVWAGLIWFFVEGETFHPIPGLPRELPLSLTVAASILVLVGSRLRSSILRRAVPSQPGLLVSEEAVIAAYRRATLVSFALLEVAASLGLVIAGLSGSAWYGHVLCAVALLGMLTRWPRAAELDRILRGRVRL